MTRDEALKIADSIMRRVEADGRVMHRDSLADELMMRVQREEPSALRKIAALAKDKK